MPEEAHEEVVRIDDMAVDGAGVARLRDGCVAFVDGALAGDLARVRVIGRRRRLALAELVVIEDPSPERVVSRCDLERCGGCPIKGLSYAAQLRRKVARLVATVRRVGGIDAEAVLLEPLVPPGDGWQYRHRVRLQATWRQEAAGSGRFLVGYHERRSHNLVPLSTCPVAWPELERLGRALAAGVAQLPHGAGLRSIEVAYSRRDNRGSALICAEGSAASFRESLQWVRDTELSGLEVRAGDGSFRWGNLELRYDHGQADQFDLRHEAGLFTQANVAANDLLVAEVMQAVAPSAGVSVLELHAGVGNFSVPLARAGATVTATEIDRRSALYLGRNATGAGVHIDSHPLRDVQALQSLATDAQVLLIDPPRGGARAVAEALRALGARAPHKVVYVSCDPATFARDAAIIVEGSKRLQRLRAIDLFPQTPHVECVGVFA